MVGYNDQNTVGNLLESELKMLSFQVSKAINYLTTTLVFGSFTDYSAS